MQVEPGSVQPKWIQPASIQAVVDGYRTLPENPSSRSRQAPIHGSDSRADIDHVSLVVTCLQLREGPKLLMELIRIAFSADWWWHAVAVGLLGWLLGGLLAGWADWLLDLPFRCGSRCRACQTRIGWWRRSRPQRPGRARCPGCRAALPDRYRWVPILTGLLFAVYGVSVIDLQAQQIAQVVPYEISIPLRIFYHLILISLLVVATTTDILDYSISDLVTLPGLAIGLSGAFASGDLQIVHLWIDWNREELFQGAYIPGWLGEYQHLHGLAWSAAGAAVGAGGAWTVRWISRLILGQEALGFGDVTLMAMIGAFLGWQPVSFVFLLAPLLAATVGSLIPLVTGREFLPFGPFLSLAAFVVLCTWRWLWEPTRYVFGHWPSLLLLVAVATGGMTLLLSLFRAIRSIPTGRVKAERARQRNSASTDPPDRS